MSVKTLPMRRAAGSQGVDATELPDAYSSNVVGFNALQGFGGLELFKPGGRAFGKATFPNN